MNENTNGLINTITVGTSIKGDIQANGDFRLDGTLEGNITLTGKLVIGEQGRIVGNVVCQNANVIGRRYGGTSWPTNWQWNPEPTSPVPATCLTNYPTELHLP